mmetsp:Transcript_101698/g.286725  ORF Transcript_101698/g.286725 Transcript_101698/m.286725 type:complete len:291 (+) Transcript_101698:813-1685(+)
MLCAATRKAWPLSCYQRRAVAQLDARLTGRSWLCRRCWCLRPLTMLVPTSTRTTALAKSPMWRSADAKHARPRRAPQKSSKWCHRSYRTCWTPRDTSQEREGRRMTTKPPLDPDQQAPTWRPASCTCSVLGLGSGGRSPWAPRKPWPLAWSRDPSPSFEWKPHPPASGTSPSSACRAASGPAASAASGACASAVEATGRTAVRFARPLQARAEAPSRAGFRRKPQHPMHTWLGVPPLRPELPTRHHRRLARDVPRNSMAECSPALPSAGACAPTPAWICSNSRTPCRLSL